MTRAPDGRIILAVPPAAIWTQIKTVEWPPNSGYKAALAWTHKLSIGFNVLRSFAKTSDNQYWIHVSLSRPDRMPEYIDMVKVKEHFLGPMVEAYQVFPSKVDHINVHNYCLHLWAPVDQERRIANLQDLVDEKAI